MKFRNILYIVFMIFFITLSYILIDRGINVKTKRIVNYQEDSDVIYKVYLHDNEIYNKKYLNMNEKYITELVDYIDLEFDYNSLYSSDINGYYSYTVMGNLVAYEDKITDKLFEKEYTLMDTKTVVLNQNKTKEININDRLLIDYDKYINELKKFNDTYNIDVSGYLDVIVKINQNIQFTGIDKVNEDEKIMRLMIPLSYDTFKINVYNDNHNLDSFYDFSKKERVNYLLILFGLFSLSIGLSFLALTIRNMIIASKSGFNYQKELKKILDENSEIIVNVKRFYNKKKYNLIYVDSFKELMDVYKKVGNPISFREVKKDKEAIFLMTEDDNAWIYRMLNNK